MKKFTISFVGLVVKRPSTRITPKLTELDPSDQAASGPRKSISGSEGEDATSGAASQNCPTSNGSSPQMPVLKHFKWVDRTTTTPASAQPSPHVRQHHQDSAQVGQRHHQSPLLRRHQQNEYARPVLDYPVNPEPYRTVSQPVQDTPETPPTPGKPSDN